MGTLIRSILLDLRGISLLLAGRPTVEPQAGSGLHKVSSALGTLAQAALPSFVQELVKLPIQHVERVLRVDGPDVARRGLPLRRRFPYIPKSLSYQRLAYILPWFTTTIPLCCLLPVPVGRSIPAARGLHMG